MNCKITAAEGIDKVYLGRPWRKYAKVAYDAAKYSKETIFASIGWESGSGSKWYETSQNEN